MKRLSPLGPLLLTVLLSLPALASLAAGGGGDSEAEVLFRDGKRLVEANCGDCMRATRENLETGIYWIKKALDLGYSEPAIAYRELAEAYRVLALVYAAPDSDDQLRALEKQWASYRRLFEIEPDNTAALYEYAMSLRDDGEQRKVLERILEIDPENLDARFVIALLELSQGNAEQGLGSLQAVFEAAVGRKDGRQIELFGERLEWALRDLGRKAEAEEIARRCAKLADKQVQ